ncbi:rho GTPase activating protein [Naegleria gruberi]|uniref:Rho GTPase activating protein n=1 Tax=Naegleria gruberi TaxID=5762 RepID=D2V7T1_NAEGR|nr:rho GTPase activating protein [Naegleria gruberi]EFC47056.1 rho GTPase activating protein [Naegleria gruberi]|eukprot:XP_002679800.1 rho GTPase activating protein [Naegleria gruberi strain NEG-M]
MSEVPTNNDTSILDAEEEKALNSMPRRSRRYSPFTALPPDELIRDEQGGSFSEKHGSINIKTTTKTPSSAPSVPSFNSEEAFSNIQSPKSAKIEKFTTSVDEETSTEDFQPNIESSLPVEEEQQHQEGDQTTPQDGTPLLSPFSQLVHKTPYAHITDLVTNSLSKVEKRSKHLSCNSVMEFSDLLKQAGVEMDELQEDEDGGVEYTKDINDLGNENFDILTPSKSSIGTMSEYDSEPEYSTPASDHEETPEYEDIPNSTDDSTKQPARLSMGRFLEPSRITCTIDEEGNVTQSSSSTSSPPVYTRKNSGDLDSNSTLSPTSPSTRRVSVKRKKSIRNDFMKGGRYGTVPKDFFTTLFKRGDSKEFGVELNTVMSRKSELGHEIPAIIEEMMVVISEKMNVEGLFRIGGNVKEMEALIKKMDAGKVVDLRTLNIHVITGLTKKYIRQAKLLTPESFEVFKKVLQMDKDDDIMKELTKLFSDVSIIPYYNCLLLNRLLHLLYNIHRKSDVNQMTAHNLAIIFAPNLFQDGSASLSNNLVLQTKGTRIIALMIEKYDEVLKPLFQKLKERNDLKPEKIKQHGLVDESQILMKGFVSKRTKVKSWKRRYAVLTATQLLLFEDDEICKKKLEAQFDFGKDVILVDYPKKEYSFKIYKIRVEEDDIKEWAIRAENESEKQEWMKRIEKIVESFKSTHQ